MLLINLNKNRGVALLYAVLLVSIVLTISLSLLNITYKQIILTAVSRESQMAHFTAMSALDCIYFIDRSYRVASPSLDDKSDNPFGVFTFSPSFQLGLPSPLPGPGTPLPISCGSGSNQINVTVKDPDPVRWSPDGVSYIISDYEINGAGLAPGCAKATVVKVYSGDYADFGEGNTPDFRGTPGGDSVQVMTTVSGYNTCDNSSSRRVERRARVRSR